MVVSGMAWQIREARLPDDADDLARLYVGSALHHVELDPGMYRVPEVRVVADRFRAAAHDAGQVVLMADAAGLAVGFAAVTMLTPPSPASMLADMPAASVEVAVHPDRRRQGIGSALMQAVAERARSLGARCIRLDAHADNEAALGLYHRLGYRPTGILMQASVDEV